MPSERLVVVRLARAHLHYGDSASFERLVVDAMAAVHHVRAEALRGELNVAALAARPWRAYTVPAPVRRDTLTTRR